MHASYVFVKKYLVLLKYNTRGDRGSEFQEKMSGLMEQARRHLLALLDVLASSKICNMSRQSSFNIF